MKNFKNLSVCAIASLLFLDPTLKCVRLFDSVEAIILIEPIKALSIQQNENPSEN